jgi:hypothetical protein
MLARHSEENCSVLVVLRRTAAEWRVLSFEENSRKVFLFSLCKSFVLLTFPQNYSDFELSSEMLFGTSFTQNSKLYTRLENGRSDGV